MPSFVGFNFENHDIWPCVADISHLSTGGRHSGDTAYLWCEYMRWRRTAAHFPLCPPHSDVSDVFAAAQSIPLSCYRSDVGRVWRAFAEMYWQLVRQRKNSVNTWFSPQLKNNTVRPLSQATRSRLTARVCENWINPRRYPFYWSRWKVITTGIVLAESGR